MLKVEEKETFLIAAGDGRNDIGALNYVKEKNGLAIWIHNDDEKKDPLSMLLTVLRTRTSLLASSMAWLSCRNYS
jgi:hypothetical protein